MKVKIKHKCPRPNKTCDKVGPFEVVNYCQICDESHFDLICSCGYRFDAKRIDVLEIVF